VWLLAVLTYDLGVLFCLRGLCATDGLREFLTDRSRRPGSCLGGRSLDHFSGLLCLASKVIGAHLVFFTHKNFSGLLCKGSPYRSGRRPDILASKIIGGRLGFLHTRVVGVMYHVGIQKICIDVHGWCVFCRLMAHEMQARFFFDGI
jgi:hypothetical protein